MSIGPNFRRYVWPVYEEPQDYGVSMDAGQSARDYHFTVHFDDDSRVGFRYEAKFNPADWDPRGEPG